MTTRFYIVCGAAALALTFSPAAMAKSKYKAKDLQAAVEKAHADFAADQEGANADYIPVLAEVDSELFGVTLVTADGKVYEAGDTDYQFSIQSIAKAFVVALAIEDVGADAVVEKIGVNATGRAFNSIIAIEDTPARTINPLVNAGAIATTSLLPGETADQRWERIQKGLSAMAGRELVVLEDVYESESATNTRNQAITSLLTNYGRMYSDGTEALDLYTRQGCLGVSSHDLAVMGATLANGGTNPVTDEVILSVDNVPKVLSVMATAGLYETTGQWIWTVGLPAKSGVGGGIVAVSPGNFAIAAFSPRLDGAGNSVRAQKAIAQVVEALGAHAFSTKR